MIARFDQSDGLGAIYPPIVWSIVALKCLGYPDDSSEVQYCRKQLLDLVLKDETDDTVRLQPCKSPVWDTAIAVRALVASGVRPEHPAIHEAVDWLLEQQIRDRGDWAETVDAEPGGWCFEWANSFYPDNDDTAMVLLALQTQFADSQAGHSALPPELHLAADSDATNWGRAVNMPNVRRMNEVARPEQADDLRNMHELSGLRHGVENEAHEELASMQDTVLAIDRGLRWMLAMQNRDGGWGAFDRNNDREFLCHVPFADHNAMIDPSTPDLTGRVLESLGRLGHRLGDPAVDRAVAYVRRSQKADGSWFGRWGVNYIYGTWQSLVGLVGVGVPADDPAVVAGANWLLAHQQSCGGWGESPASYDFPHLRGQGAPTASQTAWALMGLMAAGHVRPSGRHARNSLPAFTQQQENGTWDEPEFTGTGFPRVFYLRYHYYPIYFPLLALSQWAMTVNPDRAVRAPVHA